MILIGGVGVETTDGCGVDLAISGLTAGVTEGFTKSERSGDDVTSGLVELNGELAEGNTLNGSNTNAINTNSTNPPVAEIKRPFTVPRRRTPPTKNIAKNAAASAIR